MRITIDHNNGYVPSKFVVYGDIEIVVESDWKSYFLSEDAIGPVQTFFMTGATVTIEPLAHVEAIR